MAWLFRLSLIHYLISLLYVANLATAAPTCTFSCPGAAGNGHTLITSVSATRYDGPYSIFDCVYASPGTQPQTCHYYKSNGFNALGTETGGACPKQAIPCSEDQSPQFSAPEKPEVPPWIGPGKDLLWQKENHPPPNPPSS